MTPSFLLLYRTPHGVDPSLAHASAAKHLVHLLLKLEGDDCGGVEGCGRCAHGVLLGGCCCAHVGLLRVRLVPSLVLGPIPSRHAHGLGADPTATSVAVVNEQANARLGKAATASGVTGARGAVVRVDGGNGGRKARRHGGNSQSRHHSANASAICASATAHAPSMPAMP